MIGVLILLAIGATLALAAGAAAVAWDALHPPRRTTAWALARGTALDPEPLGRPWRTVRHALDDGAVIECWEIDGDRADGAIVVIVHGWGRSRWDSLRRAGPFLAGASRVWLPDLRGHGTAEGRTSLGGREPHDLVELLARLDAGARGRAIVLVGHSMGAGIVIRAAVSLDPPPAAIVAIAPYERVSTPISARVRRRALPATLLVPPAMLLLRAFGVRDEPLSPWSARLASPLLVLSCEEDELSPPRDGRTLAKLAPRSRGRFVLFAGNDHADPGAGEPERERAELDRFLAESLDRKEPVGR